MMNTLRALLLLVIGIVVFQNFVIHNQKELNKDLIKLLGKSKENTEHCVEIVNDLQDIILKNRAVMSQRPKILTAYVDRKEKEGCNDQSH